MLPFVKTKRIRITVRWWYIRLMTLVIQRHASLLIEDLLAL